MKTEPRKFSKYNPSLSTRSNHEFYRNYNHRNPNRKTGYIATGPVALNTSLPSKYLYTKNIEPQHDVRPSNAQGKSSDMVLKRFAI